MILSPISVISAAGISLCLEDFLFQVFRMNSHVNYMIGGQHYASTYSLNISLIHRIQQVKHEDKLWW